MAVEVQAALCTQLGPAQNQALTDFEKCFTIEIYCSYAAVGFRLFS